MTGLPHRAAPLRKSHAMACEIARGEPAFEFPSGSVRLIKADTTEERFVLGVVLEPEVEDSQGDIYSAAEIRRAAHKYMEDARNLGIMHRQLANDGMVILENFIAPVDFEMNGERVRKGTWLLGIRVKSATLWAKVRSGEFTGFSIGGSAIRTPEPRPQS